MPEKNKTLEKEIRTKIKELNRQTGAKLSFTGLYEAIVSANESYKQEGDRDQEMIVIFNDGIRELSDKMLTRHSAIVSNPILRAKYKDDPAATYTIMQADTQMKDLIAKMLEYYDPDVAKGFFWTEKQLDAIYQYEHAAVRGRNRSEEWPKCLKEWDHQCFYKDMELIEKEFDPKDTTYKYNSRHQSDKDVKAAELYYKAKIIEDQVEGYGFFMRLIYRIFNSKMMNAYDAYVQKAKETLGRIGFDEERHGARVQGMLYGKIMPPHENDVNYVESMRNKGALENESKVLEIKTKLIENAKVDMEQALDEYNKEHGTNLTYPNEDKSKSAQNNSKTVDNTANKNEKKENTAHKGGVVDEKVNKVDKKESSTKNPIKDLSVENIQKPQDDVMKADPFRNKIDVHDDVDDILPFGDAPEIKVVAPPKKGFIKKFFGKK